MSDPRTQVRHEMERLELRPFTLEDFHARRDRKRRNQRIAAGVVGIGVFVATIWIVAAGEPLERGLTPAGTTGTTDTSSHDATLSHDLAITPYYSAKARSKVDYLIDLNDGAMTPLPEAITGTLGEATEPHAFDPLSRYAVSPDGSTLAFVGTGEEGTPQIYVAGIDGSGLRQVTHDPTQATSPAWSPDGTSIAYAGGGDDASDLFVVDVATGDATQVTEDEDAHQPTFTPDGRSLIFGGGSDEVPQLHIVPIDGGQSRVLIHPADGIEDSGDGTLSPDGSLITFLGGGFPTSGEVEHCGPCRLVANADGSDRRVIGGWMATAAGMWSPDGSRIVTMDIEGEYSDLMLPIADNIILVVDVATGRPTVVANGRAAIWLDDHTLLVAV